MQPVSPTAIRYDRRTIYFHWATLILIAAQWLLGEEIDAFARGAPRVAARSTHIMLGLLIAAVFLARVTWRATQGRRLPAADQGALHVVAKATHWGMYGLIAVALSLGVITAFAQAVSIYGWFQLPALMPGNQDIGDQTAGIHGTVVTILLILAGVHAAAALVHQFIWRDRLILRMVPGP